MAKLAKTQMYVAGEWLIPSTGEYFESFNPYTGKPWMLVARGGVEDAHRAVEAAHNAFENPEWREMTPSARGQLLRRFGDLIGDNAERLAKIEVQDNGKLYSEMSLQMRYTPQWYHYFGGLADKIEGAVLPLDKSETFAFTRHEPLGVCVAILPWNSPLFLLSLIHI